MQIVKCDRAMLIRYNLLGIRYVKKPITATQAYNISSTKCNKRHNNTHEGSGQIAKSVSCRNKRNDTLMAHTTIEIKLLHK